MTLVVQGLPWGYHRSLGTTPHTTRLEPGSQLLLHPCEAGPAYRTLPLLLIEAQAEAPALLPKAFIVS